ncbi:MAG: hypothetical protein ACREU2_11530 [Steroidobacteraceae bacterium]
MELDIDVQALLAHSITHTAVCQDLQQAQRSQRAQAAGNVTLEQTSADLAVLQDVASRLGDAERSLLTAEQGLR